MFRDFNEMKPVTMHRAEIPKHRNVFTDMILTIWFTIMVASGALMLGFSAHAPLLAPIGVGLASLAVAMAVADWLFLTRQTPLEIERTCDEKLSLGVENVIKIRLRNPSYSRMHGELRDEYPEGFESSGNVIQLIMKPRSEVDMSYHVTPPNRGDFQFADIYVRLHGPLKMVVRQVKYSARRHVKVYPNLLDMRRYDVSLRRRALQPGQRVARVYGRGTEFESLRDYQVDDEYRSVDWKATARRGKLVVRQYQQEKSQSVMIVLDCGRVMGPVIEGLTRLDHGINGAMMLAHVAAVKGDKVGLMAFGEDILAYSPPKSGRSQTLNLLSMTYALENASGDSNYHRAFPYLARKWTRRSLVVVFTDLVDPESSKPLISQITHLTKKYLCVCVVMNDPAVLAAARTKPRDARDAFRAAAARQSLQARKLAGAQLARAGAIVLDVPPEKFTPSAVDQYLDIKARGRL
ncbi:MAG: hypothetical protein A2Z18_08705 [Armatimonadetes bacterium RBG_16_58_9]|nr:MAG: hypothetical protein A2Z18_08705 [Armatimonadetes bacterium RBG_16_58_9]